MDVWDRSPERPVLLGQMRSPTSVTGPRSRESTRVEYRGGNRRSERIEQGLQASFADLESQISLSAAVSSSDPQLVVVLEAVESRVDLESAVRRLGMEVLVEVDDAREPDDEYILVSARPQDPVVKRSLHATCATKDALDAMMKAWRRYKETGKVPGNVALTKLFDRLDDLRPWGPRDRIKLDGAAEALDGLLDDRLHPVEIELWFRRGPAARAAAEARMGQLVREAGGQVVARALHEQIGYHALRCEMPKEFLVRLVTGDLERVRLVRAPEVMYLHRAGQNVGAVASDGAVTDRLDAPLPGGAPAVCLLDGVPVQRHPLLEDRVIVFDPDGLEDASPVSQRRHGTAMTSALVWGDLSASEPCPAERPVLVRPVMAPSGDPAGQVEAIPPTDLVADLMWRVFRELFESTDGVIVGQEITIVNISIGDSAMPFDTIPSSWARMLDWLSFHYGVLVIVSAGNHPALPLQTHTPQEFASLSPEDRRSALLDSQLRDAIHRRLLSPAESINAISVGATHEDLSQGEPSGYQFDPLGGLPSISPVTPIASGYRRSIKPELAISGGRVLATSPLPGQHDQRSVEFTGGSVRGPGIRVAHASLDAVVTHTSGTSPAAALVSRHAARLHDAVLRTTHGRALTRRQHAVAIKALLVHGAEEFQPGVQHDAVDLATGYGALVRDFADGCTVLEAVVLYVGSLRPNQARELVLPLPEGLKTRDVKKLDATLAWLSPVNWRHRYYRQAQLDFVKPEGVGRLGPSAGRSIADAKRGASTVKHVTWDIPRVLAVGRGDELTLRVQCFGQAGADPEQDIDFAVALSLAVAPQLGVDVYADVRSQIPLPVRARPAP